jgi:pimeloyl-ACP methyl ester carboxylesterase
MNVVVNGLMTNYQKSGEGPIILFLHGWSDNSVTFEPLINILPKKYQILLLDLPGFGGTQVPEQAWGLDDYASFVAAWLKKIGVNRVNTIVAHSNGGSIAIKGLSTGKIKAEKLVLIASAGVRNRQKTRKQLLKAVAKGGKAATFFLPGGTKQRVRRRFYESIGSDATLLPKLEETFRKVVAEDVQADAARLKLPTLLIYGDSDKKTPLGHGKLLAGAIVNSQLVPVADTGHFVHQEQPQQTAELIEDFIIEG